MHNSTTSLSCVDTDQTSQNQKEQQARMSQGAADLQGFMLSWTKAAVEASQF